MDKKRIEELVKQAAVEGRLACSAAHQLAEQYQISLEEIGAAAERLDIKVTACQLGCF